MGRYKKSYLQIGIITIFFLLLLIPIDILGFNYIRIDGPVKKSDIKNIKNINKKKDIIINIDSVGGKLNHIFNFVDEMIKIKKSGIKIYTVIDKDSVVFAGSFFIPLFSDIVFYTNPINLGALAPLKDKSYKIYKNKFDKIFSILSQNSGIPTKRYKQFFLYGENFKPEKISSINNKYIKIEKKKDINLILPKYNIVKKSKKDRYLSIYASPNTTFLIVNLSILSLFFTIYISKKRVYFLFTYILIFLLWKTFDILPIRFDTLFAIFFSHFIILFKNFTKIKRVLIIFSFSIFLISSILLIFADDYRFYIEKGYHTDIIVIVITFISLLIIYQFSLGRFNKRVNKFTQHQNSIIGKKGKVIDKNGVITLSGDNFKVRSKNHLEIDDIVKIVAVKQLYLIVERVD